MSIHIELLRELCGVRLTGRLVRLKDFPEEPQADSTQEACDRERDEIEYALVVGAEQGVVYEIQGAWPADCTFKLFGLEEKVPSGAFELWMDDVWIIFPR